MDRREGRTGDTDLCVDRWEAKKARDEWVKRRLLRPAKIAGLATTVQIINKQKWVEIASSSFEVCQAL